MFLNNTSNLRIEPVPCLFLSSCPSLTLELGPIRGNESRPPSPILERILLLSKLIHLQTMLDCGEWVVEEEKGRVNVGREVSAVE